MTVGQAQELIRLYRESDVHHHLNMTIKDSNAVAFIELVMGKDNSANYLDTILRTDDIISSLFIKNYTVIKQGEMSYYIISQAKNVSAFKIAVDTKLMTATTHLNADSDRIALTVRFGEIGKEEVSDFSRTMRTIETLKTAPAYSKGDATFDAVLNSYKVALLECTVETEQHCGRLSAYNKLIAEELGLDVIETQRCFTLGWLHDIGKIAIEDSILKKPAKLDQQEWIRMEEHPTIGWRILKDIPGYKEIAEGVKHHHERFDGNGYPYKKKGEDIPLISRITTVTDSFDTMLSARVYKDPMPLEYAVGELLDNKGKQFDPTIVDIFVKLLSDGSFERLVSSYRAQERKLG